MPGDYRLHLDDILGAVGRVRSFTAAMGYEESAGDRKTVVAVVRNLGVIGEAAARPPGRVAENRRVP